MVDEKKSAPGQGRASEAAFRAARLVKRAARAAEREEIEALRTGAVARVASAVVHELSLQAVVDVMLDQCVSTLGACCATVHRWEEELQELRLLGHRNLPDDLASAMRRLPHDTPLVVCRATSSRQVQVASRSTVHHVLDCETLDRTGCNAIAAIPLLAQGQLVGVMSLARPAGHELVPQEELALSTCAEIFAFGLFNAALYEEERRLHGLFESVGRLALGAATRFELGPALQCILDEARNLASAQYAALGIGPSVDDPVQSWVYSGLTKEQAASLGWPPLNHPSIKSFLGIPVRYQGRDVGSLYVANKDNGADFTREDRQAIELLGAHAGAAVYQSHLREQADRERLKFMAIVENAPHGLVFIDAATTEVVANRRAMKIAGASVAREAVPAPGWLGTACTPEGRPISEEQWPSRRAMRGEALASQEMLLRTPDGREVPVLMSAARIERDNGIPEGVVVVYEDISPMKQLQQLREEWAAVVTHDLRQPLNTIVGYVDMLHQMLDRLEPERFRRGLEQTRCAAERLKRMVGDLADVSQLDTKRLPLRPEAIELVALASLVVERHQAATSDRTIVLRTAGVVPRVWADPVRVEQVFDNLLCNALKYSPPGPTVRVEVLPAHGEVVVTVSNLGPGIRAADLPKIFDRYYRTPAARAGAADGLGLGLYIAKGLVESQGGHISAESVPGEVTTFRFTLPFVREVA